VGGDLWSRYRNDAMSICVANRNRPSETPPTIRWRGKLQRSHR